jgi:hypothetical protein
VPGPIGGGDLEGFTRITSSVALDAGEVQIGEQVVAYFQIGDIGGPPVNQTIRLTGPDSEDFHLSSRWCYPFSSDGRCDSIGFLCSEERCWFWIAMAPSQLGRREAILEIGSTSYELTGVGLSGSTGAETLAPESETSQPSSPGSTSTPSQGTNSEPTMSSGAEPSASTG